MSSVSFGMNFQDVESLSWPSPSAPQGESLLPLVVQDGLTGQVLMLGYVNRASLLKTLETGNVVFYSRSKGRLWMKGETSGAFLALQSLHVDCDQDTLLAIVTPHGPTCHRGSTTCFDAKAAEKNHSKFEEVNTAYSFLGKLQRIVAERSLGKEKESYTSQLLSQGLDRVLKKVGEEAGEVIIAAKNLRKEDSHSVAEFHGECADLLFHWMVVCQSLGVDPALAVETLRTRENAPRRNAPQK